jgi:rod shape-determining protein MreB
VGILRERIAIDLGTAYSIVAHESTDELWRLPSSIAIDRMTGRPIAYGDRAKVMFEKGSQNIDVVRPLKDGVISDFEAAGLYLSYLVSKSRRNPFALNFTIHVCVPWGATPVEVKSYIHRLNSFRTQVRIVREPFAAALGCGVDILHSDTATVMDIGGGTVEISTMGHGCMIQCTSTREAGHAMDQLIVEKILRHKFFEVGLNTAEEMKMKYGSVEALEKEEEFEVRGIDRRSRGPSRIVMTTAELREFIEPMIEHMELRLTDHLRHLPTELRKNAENYGIFLVGGGAHLRGWKERLEKRLSLRVLSPESPQLAVIRGLKKIIDHPRKYRSLIQVSENS